MESHDTPVLNTEKLFSRFITVCKNNRYPILSSLIFGFLAHMFTFTNKQVNHDELSALFHKGATINSGRWGLELMSYIFPDYSMPWIYGVLSILLLTVGIVLIIRAFPIRSKLLQVLTAGLIITFPSLTGTFCYMFTSSSYALSFMLAAFAAYFLCRNTKKGFLPALVCMVLSVGIYQSYIAITASLLVLFLILRVLRNDDEKSILRQGVVFVLFLILSLGLYWLVTKIVWSVSGTGIGTYADRALAFDLSKLLESIGTAYLNFYRTIRYRYYGFIRDILMRNIHYLALILIGLEVLFWMVKHRKPSKILLLLVLLALFPLSVYCMFLFAAENTVHALVLYSFSMVYVLAAVVVDNGCLTVPKQKVLKLCRSVAFDLVALGMAVILVCNTYAANEVYLNMQLRYENTYSLCNTLLARIQMTPGYTADTRVALMGEWEEPDFYEEFTNTSWIAGTQGVTLNSWSKWYFFYYYCGTNLKLANGADIEKVAASADYTEMPCYPDAGSVAMIEDVIVVKLSE